MEKVHCWHTLMFNCYYSLLILITIIKKKGKKTHTERQTDIKYKTENAA